MRGVVSIPNHPQLIRELRLLERRASRSGRDVVDHDRNGSDNHANAVAGTRRGLAAPAYDYDSSQPFVGTQSEGMIIARRVDANPLAALGIVGASQQRAASAAGTRRLAGANVEFYAQLRNSPVGAGLAN